MRGKTRELSSPLLDVDDDDNMMIMMMVLEAVVIMVTMSEDGWLR